MIYTHVFDVEERKLYRLELDSWPDGIQYESELQDILESAVDGWGGTQKWDDIRVREYTGEYVWEKCIFYLKHRAVMDALEEDGALDWLNEDDENDTWQYSCYALDDKDFEIPSEYADDNADDDEGEENDEDAVC